MAAIYKSGQGYYTRLISAIGWGLLLLMGVSWLWEHLATIELFGQEGVYTAAGGAVIFCGVGGFLLYYLIGRKPKVVDFMIATEGELKKVNWSSRREVLGSTWVVIGLTLLIAGLLFVYDLAFAELFKLAGVLKTD